MKVYEAQTKVCPFIQSTSATNDSSCSDYNIHKNINCICGDCMAWQWNKKEIDRKSFYAGTYAFMHEYFEKEDLEGFEYKGVEKTGDRSWTVFVKYSYDEGYCKRLEQL